MTVFTEIAETISKDIWGFHPNRQIKPVHLANGLFRALFGQTGSPTLIQKAAGGFRRGKSPLTTEAFLHDDQVQSRFELDDGEDIVGYTNEVRSALDLVLSQDRALFGKGPFSLTLTHRLHVSTDPSDQHTGQFLAEVLAASSRGDVVGLLRRTLLATTDNVYLLSAPLLVEREEGAQPLATDTVTRLVSLLPVLQSVQDAFGTLAAYCDLLEKTLFLQQVVTLGSLSLFLHLINRASGETSADRCLVPILLCAPSPLPDVRDASRQSLARARQRVELAFEQGLDEELGRRGQQFLSEAEYQELARSWLPSEDGDSKGASVERSKVWDRFSQDFPGFLAGGASPHEAFVQAAVRAAFVNMQVEKGGGGENPETAAISIGRMLGLIYPRQRDRGERFYQPTPHVLDTLVSALLTPGEEVTIEAFWQRAWSRFGIVCGARGTLDVQELAAWGIHNVSLAHLGRNAREMLLELVRMGHASEYADDVAMIRAGGTRDG